MAVGKCIRRHPTWPPTIPEFVALCDVDAEELGLPPIDIAWMEAQRKANQTAKYSHQAIHEAVKRAGAYDIARATSQSEQKTMKAKFESEYNSIAKAMASGTLMLESDRQHSPDKLIERKMIEEGNRKAAEMGFAGIKAEDALAQMKQRLRNAK